MAVGGAADWDAAAKLVLKLLPLHHSLLKIERPAVDDERAVSLVVKRPLFLAFRIHPGRDGFQNEQVVLLYKTGILHSTLDISQAFGHERGGHLTGRSWREAESLELFRLIAGTVADVDDLGGEVDAWNCQDAFAVVSQRAKAIVPRPDDAADQGRIMLNHHVEPDRHEVGALAVERRNQEDRAWFDESIDLGCWKLVHLGIT